MRGTQSAWDQSASLAPTDGSDRRVCQSLTPVRLSRNSSHATPDPSYLAYESRNDSSWADAVALPTRNRTPALSITATWDRIMASSLNAAVTLRIARTRMRAGLEGDGST